MKYEHLPYNKNLKQNAVKLRKNMTKQEKHLWYDFLKDYPIKIYKQKVILNYIVDFYCASAKLAIELDGSQHYDGQEDYDAARTKALNGMGITVLRFSNLEIDTNFKGVCEYIDLTIQKQKEN